jgi:4-hydroxybenzoate polyprenyltransferase
MLAHTQWGHYELWRIALLLGLFGIGAIAMRGAGCTYNDIVDRNIDAKVERTRSRPLPSGAVSVAGATAFLLLQMLLGLTVLLTFNDFAIGLGFSSLILVAVYPFMKRFTYWPQFFLGLAFSFGALLGWAAYAGSLDVAPWLLYLGAIFWVMGYDTIYAHQDKEDDVIAGVKSTALKFGSQTKLWLAFFFSCAVLLITLAGIAAQAGQIFYVAVLAPALHLAWQVKSLDIDDAASCLRLFRANRETGGLIFVACLLSLPNIG